MSGSISTHAPAGGATAANIKHKQKDFLFLLTPLREGRPANIKHKQKDFLFLLTPLREGRRKPKATMAGRISTFLLTPLREGRHPRPALFRALFLHFYSRPCGRGDLCGYRRRDPCRAISTHAPAGGATGGRFADVEILAFLLTPLREGRRRHSFGVSAPRSFLLTPLREGRRASLRYAVCIDKISTHAPAGGATHDLRRDHAPVCHFYSRPCGRGDFPGIPGHPGLRISTHAPAGGATLRPIHSVPPGGDFYSRPCGRGDTYGAVSFLA